MSGTPKEIVTAFLAAWANGVDSLRQSFADYLSDDVVCENVDMTYAPEHRGDKQDDGQRVAPIRG